MNSPAPEMSHLFQALVESKNLVFMTGAGVSTASGISDFRSHKGLSSKEPKFEKKLHINYLNQNPKRFWEFYDTYMRIPEGVEPNVTHKAIAEIAKSRPTTVLTQNVDGLHEAVGEAEVLALHGNRTTTCTICAESTEDYPFHANCPAERISLKGFPKPSLVRPNVVLYGERLDENLWAKAVAKMALADTLVIVGTSLKVYPFAGLTAYFRGDKAFYLNQYSPEETPALAVPLRQILGDFNVIFDHVYRSISA